VPGDAAVVGEKTFSRQKFVPLKISYLCKFRNMFFCRKSGVAIAGKEVLSGPNTELF
jgi:hypothetical protein